MTWTKTYVSTTWQCTQHNRCTTSTTQVSFENRESKQLRARSNHLIYIGRLSYICYTWGVSDLCFYWFHVPRLRSFGWEATRHCNETSQQNYGHSVFIVPRECHQASPCREVFQRWQKILVTKQTATDLSHQWWWGPTDYASQAHCWFISLYNGTFWRYVLTTFYTPVCRANATHHLPFCRLCNFRHCWVHLVEFKSRPFACLPSTGDNIQRLW